ncbi:MAG: hypothetical protein H6Q69_316 [Firmicutes bacterium]|nr:hypothetical protein [Bacillota bacterium]
MEQPVDVKAQIRYENRVAATWLIHYRERKRDHDERRQEIEAGLRESDENVGGGRSSLPGRPVESLTCNLDQHDNNNTAKWLKVVEDTKAIVGPKKRQLLELRQECRFYISPDGGRPGWIAPVQNRFGEITGWCPAEQTLKNLWADVVTTAVRVALARGCKFII